MKAKQKEAELRILHIFIQRCLQNRTLGLCRNNRNAGGNRHEYKCYYFRKLVKLETIERLNLDATL